MNPLDDEAVLLEIVEYNQNSPVQDKTTFRFANNSLSFEKEVNTEKSDAAVNHAISNTQLDIVHNDTWTESLFYGIGNKSM